MANRKNKSVPMGVDLSALAAEKISRSEAIDLMIDEAREACNCRIADLERQLEAATSVSFDQIREMIARGDCVLSNDVYRDRDDVVQFRKSHAGDAFYASLTVKVARSESDTSELQARLRESMRIGKLLEQEKMTLRAFNDKSRVKSAVLKSILNSSREGVVLLEQLRSAAEQFRASVATNRALMNG